MYKNSPIIRWRKYNEQYLLVGNKCINCEAIYYPKKYLCNCNNKRTLQNSLEDFQLSGKGAILSYTEIRSAPEEYKDQVPYCLGIIQLEEGPRIIAQITDCIVTDLKIGMFVEAVLRRFYKVNEEGIIHYGIKFKLCGLAQDNIIFTNEVSKN